MALSASRDYVLGVLRAVEFALHAGQEALATEMLNELLQGSSHGALRALVRKENIQIDWLRIQRPYVPRQLRRQLHHESRSPDGDGHRAGLGAAVGDSTDIGASNLPPQQGHVHARDGNRTECAPLALIDERQAGSEPADSRSIPAMQPVSHAWACSSRLIWESDFKPGTDETVDGYTPRPCDCQSRRKSDVE